MEAYDLADAANEKRGYWLVRFVEWAEKEGLVWRVTGPNATASGTRAEAMVRKPGAKGVLGQWVFGYGDDGPAACNDCIAWWRVAKEADATGITMEQQRQRAEDAEKFEAQLERDGLK